ncbi:hypothetical protein [Streptomyces reniochalinae]|uniref:hypothetical protein n=1 Tax=Streptomyces reniochalinae TaxID=2250578 RepID=UPI0015F0662C|nr:hypothetical protein [Streptomyces reniochalinae]
MKPDRPVCFDISNVDDSETLLQAAALLSCRSYGFGAVSAAQALADAGLEPQCNYFLVMDELWRVLQAGRGLVDRLNALTRLDRQRGVGLAMVTHTIGDLFALPTEEDRIKAKGFVERSGMASARAFRPGDAATRPGGGADGGGEAAARGPVDAPGVGQRPQPSGRSAWHGQLAHQGRQ